MRVEEWSKTAPHGTTPNLDLPHKARAIACSRGPYVSQLAGER